jgi:hypothetical protein
MKHYSPNRRRNHGRPLKRLLDKWDQNRSTIGPTPWQIYEMMMTTDHLITCDVTCQLLFYSLLKNVSAKFELQVNLWRFCCSEDKMPWHNGHWTI